MCGRYQITTAEQAMRRLFEYSGPPLNIPPRYNVAPTQDVPAIVAADGGRQLRMMRWGLVPSWAKDVKIGAKMINARAESAADKPAFRAAFKSRRCLIPADGFYEWKKQDQGARQPYLIYLYDGLFAFAGLWERWAGPDGEVLSCTILTTEANLVVRNIHDRMPSILEPEDHARWLDPVTHESALRVMAKRQYANKKMRFQRVSTAVNSVRNDGPECIAELPPDDLLLGH